MGTMHGLRSTIVKKNVCTVKAYGKERRKRINHLYHAMAIKKQFEEGIISHKRGRENTYGYEQAYRVAWRNILDWVQAQMALLEIGMAKIEEVFLPYMQDREGAAIP